MPPACCPSSMLSLAQGGSSSKRSWAKRWFGMGKDPAGPGRRGDVQARDPALPAPSAPHALSFALALMKPDEEKALLDAATAPNGTRDRGSPAPATVLPQTRGRMPLATRNRPVSPLNAEKPAGQAP